MTVGPFGKRKQVAMDGMSPRMPETPPKGLIAILGAPGSSASVLSGVLALCGAPRNAERERGIRAACDGLLRAGGAHWRRVADFDPAAVPGSALQAARADCAGPLAHPDPGVFWTLAEPRLCLLLGLLGPFLGGLTSVHFHRNPLEAARALQARDSLGIAEGLALWEIYTRAALAASVDMPRTVISRDALLDRPAETLAGLASSLDAFGLKGLVPPDPKALEDIIAPERDVPRASEAETEAFLSPDQSRLWSALRAGRWPRTEEVGADIAPAARQILRDLEARDAADAELGAEIRELRKAKLRSDQALHAASRALSQVRRENAALVEFDDVARHGASPEGRRPGEGRPR